MMRFREFLLKLLEPFALVSLEAARLAKFQSDEKAFETIYSYQDLVFSELLSHHLVWYQSLMKT